MKKALTAAMGFTLSAVAFASGSGLDQRILNTSVNPRPPSGEEVQIKNIDLIEYTLGNNRRWQALAVYLWTKTTIPETTDPETSSSYLRTALHILDKASPAKLERMTKYVSYVGLDSATGYQVYRLDVDREPERTCLELYAELDTKWLPARKTYFSNEGDRNQFFRYCY